MRYPKNVFTKKKNHIKIPNSVENSKRKVHF